MFDDADAPLKKPAPPPRSKSSAWNPCPTPRHLPGRSRPRQGQGKSPSTQIRSATPNSPKAPVSLWKAWPSRFARPASKTCPLSSRATSPARSRSWQTRWSVCRTEKVRIKGHPLRRRFHHWSDVCWPPPPTPFIIGFNVRPERKAAELAQQGRHPDFACTPSSTSCRTRFAWPCWACSTPHSRRLRGPGRGHQRLPHPQKVGAIAGCRVQDGVIRRDAEVKSCAAKNSSSK